MKHLPSTETALSAIHISIGPKNGTRKTLTSLCPQRDYGECELRAVFANIVDAQSWPSWYPNSHNVVVHDSPDINCTKGRSSLGTRSVYTSRAPYTS